jgi:hypothetical protein
MKKMSKPAESFSLAEFQGGFQTRPPQKHVTSVMNWDFFDRKNMKMKQEKK